MHLFFVLFPLSWASHPVPVPQKGGAMKLTGKKALITGGNSGIGGVTGVPFGATILRP
jgi:hypothetical protein